MRGDTSRRSVCLSISTSISIKRWRLEIHLEPAPDFEDGIGGWSISHTKSIAVRPGCGDPVNVAVHEIAHLLLPNRCGRSTTRTKAVDEAEAELTAFLVKRCLGNRIYLSLGRRYIQDAMKKAKPLKPRLELVEKAALQIPEAGRTNHRVSPGTDCLGLAIANRDHVAATRSANFFWKNREHEPDERLPMKPMTQHASNAATTKPHTLGNAWTNSASRASEPGWHGSGIMV
jgi:hypothetical protein